jgi:hypothetical protein
MKNPYLNKPLYSSTYSFIAKVDGKTMEFVSEKEYEEYIEKPIEIIKRYFVDRNPIPFRMKVVFYKRKFDGLFFVYKTSQYFKNKPNTEVYTFVQYRDALIKYQELGGK